MAWFRIITCGLSAVLLGVLAFGFAPLNNNLLQGAALLGVPLWLTCGVLSVALAVTCVGLALPELQRKADDKSARSTPRNGLA